MEQEAPKTIERTIEDVRKDLARAQERSRGYRNAIKLARAAQDDLYTELEKSCHDHQRLYREMNDLIYGKGEHPDYYPHGG